MTEESAGLQGARAASPLRHYAAAFTAVVGREAFKFLRQRSRLVAAIVRPSLWLLVFAAGSRGTFGVTATEPYDTYVRYEEYVLPGCLGIVLLFHGMQSALSLVYDREMGMMRLLLTAPLPRSYLLSCKLAAGTLLSLGQAYVFLIVAMLFGIQIPLWGWLAILPMLALSGLMLGALGLLISVYTKQLENFAGMMNFVIFPMFFLSSALYPLWRLRENGSEFIYWVAAINPFTHAVELIRFAAYGMVKLDALAIVSFSAVVFFVLAGLGYDPQRGFIRRAPQV